MRFSSALAGNIWPFLSTFAVSKETLQEIWQNLSNIIHLEDLVFISIVGWATVPLLHIPYAIYASTKKSDPSVSGGKDAAETYQNSYLYLLADLVSQMAKLSLLVYAADCLAVVIQTMGFDFVGLNVLSKIFAKVLYLFWVTRQCQLFKRFLIGKIVSRKPDKLGKATVVDRLLDGLIYVALLMFILDFLSVEVGIALTSAFAVGSTATLVFSLASKDLAAQLVNGLALSATDKFYEGDEVRFGDGTAGIIVKMGWMYTTIRNYDEFISEIPNTQLGSQRICNVSRVQKCQVKQILRFKFEDSKKIPKLCADIKDEIVKCCPALITEGRPFRAKWSAYREDHLEVVVDCHFNLKPVGNVFWDNREKVLEAIDKAVRKNQMEYVTTFYPRSN